MEEKNLKKPSLIKKLDTYKLIISKKVEDKIRYICNKIWKDEWSGILFYTPSGRFEDGSLTIKCEDIYVMDIGTATYTEFEMSPDVISYMTENPELLNCQTGLIHSHNQMSTFFSSTDLNTLLEEGAERNHFLSLIVNNEGKYTAAITRKIQSTKTVAEDYTYNSFQGISIKDKKDYILNNEIIEYFHLNIVFEQPNCSFTDVEERLKVIKDNKEAKVIKSVPPFKDYQTFKGSQMDLFEAPSWKSDTTYIKFKNDTKESLDEKIEHLAIQLLTGNIFISKDSKIDIIKWVENMPILYKKRFGEGSEGFTNFEMWADTITEHLCYFTKLPSFTKDMEEDERCSMIASSLIEQLSMLPSNKYIDYFIQTLTLFKI